MGLKKIRKNIRAISPVLAVLMMIVIAVAGSLVTYAWVMGYLSFTTAKAGRAIQIQSVANSGDDLLVYVQNVGEGTVELDPAGLSSVYVNGGLLPVSAMNPADGLLLQGNTATLTIADAAAGPGERTRVKVVSMGGTFTEATGYPGESTGGGVILPPPTVTSARTPETVTVALSNGVGTISGFTSPTADGNLLVLTTGHRVGDPDTYNSPTIAGWDLRGVEYNNPSSGSDRRVVAIFTKISVNGESLDGTINWNNDPGADYPSWMTLREFTGAASYSYVGYDGSNTGPSSGSTTLAIPSTPLGAFDDNILGIVGMVFRDSPGTVSFTNGFGDVHTNTEITNCPGVTATVITTESGADWQTTASWTTSRLANGLLVLFTFS